jgi:hypothetical protein
MSKSGLPVLFFDFGRFPANCPRGPRNSIGQGRISMGLPAAKVFHPSLLFFVKKIKISYNCFEKLKRYKPFIGIIFNFKKSLPQYERRWGLPLQHDREAQVFMERGSTLSERSEFVIPP